MYFGLTQVEPGIISFSHSPGKIEYTGFCFKSKTKARTQKGLV